MKLLILFPGINLFTAMFVAAISENSFGIEGRLAVTIGATLATTATLSLVLSLMARQSISQRLADPGGAINAVDTGDLGVRLPALAGDEVDEVGRSFNRMVIGLQEREELRQENVGLAARGVTSSDEARRKAERDLHDGAQQHLVLLQLRIGQATRMLDKDPARVPELLRGDADMALEELRSLAHGPATLEGDGLVAALDEAAHRAAISATVDGVGVPRYPREVEAAVYFCCLEALQNAAKHASEGARAVIALSGTDGELRFEISDDGPGFDASDTSSHGLRSMQDRVGALGGRLTIESAVGRGTTVCGTAPASADVVAEP